MIAPHHLVEPATLDERLEIATVQALVAIDEEAVGPAGNRSTAISRSNAELNITSAFS